MQTKYHLLLLLSFFVNNFLIAKEIVIEDNMPIQSQFVSPDVSYIIRNRIDLSHTQLMLPLRSKLVFLGDGYFSNGELYGQESEIQADDNCIFRNIKVSGSWNNKIVYSSWFDLNEETDETAKIESILLLCEGDSYTHLHFHKGKYFVSALNLSAPIIVPSNVYWHNEATFQLMPNNYQKYSLVLVDKSINVTIDGGFFVGDLESHLDVKGEWGHGIKCRGVKNLIIRNLVCEKFWGDGIDLIEGINSKGEAIINCENVFIDNVKCLYNRRQGLSIEAANDIIIRKSEFAYTGVLNNTPPSAGIDIEPWIGNCEKIKNIVIDSCLFHDNIGYDFKCEPNVRLKEKNDKIGNKIEVKNSTMRTFRAYYANEITISNSRISSCLWILHSNNVNIVNTFINRIKRSNAINVRISNGIGNFKYDSFIVPLFFMIIMCIIDFFIVNKVRKR